MSSTENARVAIVTGGPAGSAARSRSGWPPTG